MLPSRRYRFRDRRQPVSIPSDVLVWVAQRREIALSKQVAVVRPHRERASGIGSYQLPDQLGSGLGRGGAGRGCSRGRGEPFEIVPPCDRLCRGASCPAELERCHHANRELGSQQIGRRRIAQAEPGTVGFAVSIALEATGSFGRRAPSSVDSDELRRAQRHFVEVERHASCDHGRVSSRNRARGVGRLDQPDVVDVTGESHR